MADFAAETVFVESTTVESYAIRGERIVVNGNERVVIEIRLIVHRHQRVIRHDKSPTGIYGTPSDGPMMGPRPRGEAGLALSV